MVESVNLNCLSFKLEANMWGMNYGRLITRLTSLPLDRHSTHFILLLQ